MNGRSDFAFFSRRRFLQGVAITSGMAVAGANFAAWAAEGEATDANRVKVLDWGLVPNWASAGPTLLPLSQLTFLVFPAEKIDEDGKVVGHGMAVIEFRGFRRGQFRCRGDELLATHPLDFTKLEPCHALEIENSTWVRQVQPPLEDGLSPQPFSALASGLTGDSAASSTSDADSDADSDASSDEGRVPGPLRHFVITFLGATPGVGLGASDFECLAESATAELFTRPFADILEVLKFRDLGV